ncbi:ATP-binding protein [Kitasatospora sp. NPDC086009]|uniref:ATP-binding protein n=1 Tax=unclassified Kitasatospora TaxID=2633591 RepID=UPI0037C729C4
MRNTVNGGTFFHAVVQGRNVTIQLPAPQDPALAGLPEPNASFVGRAAEAAALREALEPGAGGGPTPVALVAGLAGAGKTELALQVARQACDEPGWFPGGVLFVDLFGYDDDRRVPPERALEGLLNALGVADGNLPTGVQDRSRLYRSLLRAYAASDRRVLVVVDNGRSAAEVEPLLPTDGVTAALVTSRHTLDLGAPVHEIGELCPADSVALIGAAVRQLRPAGDTRVDDDPAAVGRIAELCGHLPLALRICAALLAESPTRTPAALAGSLADEYRRLDRLGREERRVRAVFDLSYRQLDPRTARVFRMLPLVPGPDLSTGSAERLLAGDEAEVEQALVDLARAHLVVPGEVWGRWRLHDLVRLYADDRGRACAEQDDRQEALGRLLGHFVSSAWEAESLLSRSGEVGVTSRFRGRDEAAAWLDEEWPGLLAAAIDGAALGFPSIPVLLAAVLHRQFVLRRRAGEWLAVIDAASAQLTTAGQAEVSALTAGLTSARGMALMLAGHHEEAVVVHGRASEQFGALGDRRQEAAALISRSTALRTLRRFEEDRADLERAAEIFTELGDAWGMAMVRSNVGDALQTLGRLHEALPVLAAVADEFGALADPWEGWALHNLGVAQLGSARYEEAAGTFARALEWFRDAASAQDALGEVMVLDHLAEALERAGHPAEAVRARRAALDAARRTGRPVRWPFLRLAVTLRAAGRADEAVDVLDEAAAVFADSGDPKGQAAELTARAAVLGELGRLDEAVAAGTRAAELQRACGEGEGEASALYNLGTMLVRAERLRPAEDALGRAAEVFRAIDDDHGRGESLNNLAYVLMLLGRFGRAVAAQAEAAELFHRSDDHASEAIAVEGLAALRAVRPGLRARAVPDCGIARALASTRRFTAPPCAR